MAFEFMFFPIWIMISVFLFVIFLFIFWLWAIIHCLGSRLSTIQKIFWVIIILFFHFLGALLYFILSKSMEDKMAKSKKFKGKRLYRSKNRMIAVSSWFLASSSLVYVFVLISWVSAYREALRTPS